MKPKLALSWRLFDCQRMLLQDKSTEDFYEDDSINRHLKLSQLKTTFRKCLMSSQSMTSALLGQLDGANVYPGAWCILLLFLFLWLPLVVQSIHETLVSFQFLNLRQSVGLLGRGISPSQGRYLAYTDTHALSAIPSHDPSVRASEDGSCL
jgi:hypothetical protein